jgi:hypothetical protein
MHSTSACICVSVALYPYAHVWARQAGIGQAGQGEGRQVGGVGVGGACLGSSLSLYMYATRFTALESTGSPIDEPDRLEVWRT